MTTAGVGTIMLGKAAALGNLPGMIVLGANKVGTTMAVRNGVPSSSKPPKGKALQRARAAVVAKDAITVRVVGDNNPHVTILQVHLMPISLGDAGQSLHRPRMHLLPLQQQAQWLVRMPR